MNLNNKKLSILSFFTISLMSPHAFSQTNKIDTGHNQKVMEDVLKKGEAVSEPKGGISFIDKIPPIFFMGKECNLSTVSVMDNKKEISVNCQGSEGESCDLRWEGGKASAQAYKISAHLEEKGNVSTYTYEEQPKNWSEHPTTTKTVSFENAVDTLQNMADTFCVEQQKVVAAMPKSISKKVDTRMTLKNGLECKRSVKSETGKKDSRELLCRGKKEGSNKKLLCSYQQDCNLPKEIRTNRSVREFEDVAIDDKYTKELWLCTKEEMGAKAVSNFTESAIAWMLENCK